MKEGVIVLEAVVPFPTLSNLGDDSSSLRIHLSGGTEAQTTALLRLERSPASPTDVIDATGELVTREGLVLSHWELRHRQDGSVVAGADMSPIALRPFAPYPCVVRLFGGGATAA